MLCQVPHNPPFPTNHHSHQLQMTLKPRNLDVTIYIQNLNKLQCSLLTENPLGVRWGWSEEWGWEGGGEGGASLPKSGQGSWWGRWSPIPDTQFWNRRAFWGRWVGVKHADFDVNIPQILGGFNGGKALLWWEIRTVWLLTFICRTQYNWWTRS